MELFLIRHTQVAIEKGICYGFTDVDIASTFNHEMLEIKQKIGHLKFDAVWSSPLQRCLKLTKSLFTDAKIATDKRLKELNFGDWEGKPWNEIYEHPQGKIWMDNFIDIPCPNGESFNDQITRTQSFIDDKIKTSEHKKVAIITHGGTMRAFNCIVNKTKPIDAFKTDIPYGNISQIKI